MNKYCKFLRGLQLDVLDEPEVERLYELQEGLQSETSGLHS